MQIFKEFILGFWIWWYFEKHKDFLRALFLKLSGLAQRTRFDVSIRYLFTPLYQNKSMIGLLISLPVRFARLVFGGFVQAVAVMCVFAAWMGYLAVPLAPVFILWLWIITP